MSRTPATPRSETIPRLITGMFSGLNRLTSGSSTPSAKATAARAASTSLWATAMSVPYSKDARTTELPSKLVDWTDSSPPNGLTARSMGAVTSRTTASGSAPG